MRLIFSLLSCFLKPSVWALINSSLILSKGYQSSGTLYVKIKFLPKRLGERYASALTNKNLSNKIYKYYGKINLKDYVNNFIASND